jgi:hypothetical protein
MLEIQLSTPQPNPTGNGRYPTRTGGKRSLGPLVAVRSIGSVRSTLSLKQPETPSFRSQTFGLEGARTNTVHLTILTRLA